MTEQALLKISELATETGFPISTIRHYINEDLLDTPRKKSKNMAYYDREIIPKIYLIKRLQDEHFLPLRVIKKLLNSNENLTFEEYDLFIDVRKRLEEEGNLLPEMGSIPLSQIVANLELAKDELHALEDLKVVSPNMKDGQKYYNELDYRIIKAFSDCRSSGLNNELGFTIDDLHIYLKILRDMVKIESKLFIKRVSKKRSADEIVELINKGLPAINEVISALHQKLIIDIVKEIAVMKKDS